MNRTSKPTRRPTLTRDQLRRLCSLSPATQTIPNYKTYSSRPICVDLETLYGNPDILDHFLPNSHGESHGVTA